MHDPVPAADWRHDRAHDGTDPDCVAYLAGGATLLYYDPASTTGETWLHADSPVDLREHA